MHEHLVFASPRPAMGSAPTVRTHRGRQRISRARAEREQCPDEEEGSARLGDRAAAGKSREAWMKKSKKKPATKKT
jgi:hypothetical protein